MNRINWTELKPQIQQVGRLSLPAILTQITTIAMQYIDSAMVGALWGRNASAGDRTGFRRRRGSSAVRFMRFQPVFLFR